MWLSCERNDGQSLKGRGYNNQSVRGESVAKSATWCWAVIFSPSADLWSVLQGCSLLLRCWLSLQWCQGQSCSAGSWGQWCCRAEDGSFPTHCKRCNEWQTPTRSRRAQQIVCYQSMLHSVECTGLWTRWRRLHLAKKYLLKPLNTRALFITFLSLFLLRPQLALSLI